VIGSVLPCGATVVALVLLLTACSTAPIRVEQKAIDDLTISERNAPQCTLGIELVDARPESDLGTIGFREFVFDDYLGWLHRQLKTQFRTELAAPDAAVLRLELLRAYMETNRKTLSFNVVMRAARAGDPVERSRLYRGASTRINWSGNQGELAAFIERASAEMIGHMRVGERQLCSEAVGVDGG